MAKKARKRVGAVRDPVRRGHLGYVGKSPSLKAGSELGNRQVHWESRLERDFVRLAEFSTAVVGIQDQPEKIDLGAGKFAIPDYKVTLEDGTVWIVEVKPAQKLLDPVVNARMDDVRAVVTARGDNFTAISEEAIREAPLAPNLWMLATYRRPYIERSFLEEKQARVIPLLPISFGDAKRLFSEESIVETLLGFQLLEFDYRSPLNDQTLIHHHVEANRVLFS